MPFCNECGTKMNHKSEIVTEFENRFNTVDWKIKNLYQCPNCKEVIIR